MIDKVYLLKFTLLILGICCGPIFAGLTIGFTSSAAVQLQTLFVDVTAHQIALFASLMNIGGMFGSFIVGACLDKYGRRTTLLVSALPGFLGWIFIMSTYPTELNLRVPFTTIMALYIGRILTGISCGMNMAATGVYLVEIAPTAWRGSIGGCNQLGIVIGIFLAFLGGTSLTYYKQAFVGLLFHLSLIVTVLQFAPESPRWLFKNNKRKEAAIALASIRQKTYHVEDELRDFDESMVGGDPPNVGIVSLLRSQELRPRCVIALGLMFFQQFSGINAVMFYTQFIFTRIGYAEGKSAAYCTAGVGLVQLLATLVMVRIADRFGRTSFLQFASSLMAFSLIGLAVFYLFNIRQGWVGVVFLLLYIIGFSLGWGSLPILITTEIFPLHARSTATGMAVMANWAFSFIVTENFPTFNAWVGPAPTFALFALLCGMGQAFVSRFVPETKAKTLEDIDMLFLAKGSNVPLPF